MLAIFPAHSAKAIGDGSYTAQLERYLDDHAVLRDTLLKAQVRADLLRRPVVNGIVITPECLLPYHPPLWRWAGKRSAPGRKAWRII